MFLLPCIAYLSVSVSVCYWYLAMYFQFLCICPSVFIVILAMVCLGILFMVINCFNCNSTVRVPHQELWVRENINAMITPS